MLKKYQDLLFQLVKTDFKMRYNNSVLGFIWVLLKPFLIFLILYIVFSFMFSDGDPNYQLNLLLGIIIFYYFSEGTNKGLNSIMQRADVILKIKFPHHIAVLASVLNSLISFVISLIIFFGFWIFSPTPITWWWLLFPVYILIFSILIFGFSLLASVLYIKVRDIASIWEVLTNLLFYATPIIYPMSFVPINLQKILNLNPLTAMIRDCRLMLIMGQPPGTQTFLYLLVVSLILFIFGFWYFQKNVKKVSEKI